MIAVSDAVILVVSASLLAAGVYRWQYNEAQAEEFAAGAFERPYIGSPVTSNGPGYKTDSVPSGTTSVNPGTLIGKPANQPGTSGVAGAVPPVASAVVIASADQAGESRIQESAIQVAGNPSSTQNASKSLYGVYTIEWGDTLSVLAERWGTSVDALQAINDIDGWMINVGDELRYPLPVN